MTIAPSFLGSTARRFQSQRWNYCLAGAIAGSFAFGFLVVAVGSFAGQCRNRYCADAAMGSRCCRRTLGSAGYRGPEWRKEVLWVGLHSLLLARHLIAARRLDRRGDLGNKPTPAIWPRPVYLVNLCRRLPLPQGRAAPRCRTHSAPTVVDARRTNCRDSPQSYVAILVGHDVVLALTPPNKPAVSRPRSVLSCDRYHHSSGSRHALGHPTVDISQHPRHPPTVARSPNHLLSH